MGKCIQPLLSSPHHCAGHGMTFLFTVLLANSPAASMLTEGLKEKERREEDRKGAALDLLWISKSL